MGTSSLCMACINHKLDPEFQIIPIGQLCSLEEVVVRMGGGGGGRGEELLKQPNSTILATIQRPISIFSPNS